MNDWKYVVKSEPVSLKEAGHPYLRRWALIRTRENGSGEADSEILMESHRFFEEHDTKKLRDDALRTLSILRCPISKPLDHVIKQLLDQKD